MVEYWNGGVMVTGYGLRVAGSMFETRHGFHGLHGYMKIDVTGCEFRDKGVGCQPAPCYQ
jgi:hypothetical protein